VTRKKWSCSFHWILEIWKFWVVLATALQKLDIRYAHDIMHFMHFVLVFRGNTMRWDSHKLPWYRIGQKKVSRGQAWEILRK